MDLWSTPEHKDIEGWRGPGEVVNVSKVLTEAKIHVEIGGKTKCVPLSQVRPHVADVFFLGLLGFVAEGGTAVMILIAHLEATFPYDTSKVYGLVYTGKGWIQSQAMRKDPKTCRLLQEAADSLSLDCDGALVSAGQQWVPAVDRNYEGLGVLLLWRFG